MIDKEETPTLRRVTIFNRLYRWFIAWAKKPQAEKALAGFSFAESSFFPIPPDPLLIAIVFANTKKYLRYATITVVASILGGIAGYYIGWGLFESLGRWFIDVNNLQDAYMSLGEKYNQGVFLTVLAAALTPIPYKIVTISAGAFQVAFWPFLLASIIGRSLRFYGVSSLARLLGNKYKDQIEHYINVVSMIAIALLIVLIIIVK